MIKQNSQALRGIIEISAEAMQKTDIIFESILDVQLDELRRELIVKRREWLREHGD